MLPLHSLLTWSASNAFVHCCEYWLREWLICRFACLCIPTSMFLSRHAYHRTCTCATVGEEISCLCRAQEVLCGWSLVPHVWQTFSLGSDPYIRIYTHIYTNIQCASLHAIGRNTSIHCASCSYDPCLQIIQGQLTWRLHKISAWKASICWSSRQHDKKLSHECNHDWWFSFCSFLDAVYGCLRKH